MASLFKRPVYGPAPAGAAIETDSQGRKFAVWRSGNGRTVRKRLTKAGKIIVGRSRCWYIAFSPRPNLRRTIRAVADKAASQQLARKLETDALLRRRGILTAADEAQAAAEATPIEKHLEAWRKAMLDEGRTAKHAKLSFTRARRLLADGGIDKISKLTAERVTGALGGLRDGGLSLQTVNHYRSAVRAFSRWLRRTGRARTALESLPTFNAAADCRHRRRALSDAEIARLLDAADRGPKVGGMSGRQRGLLYRLALGTGFRAGEIRSLAPESFDLDGDPATVTVAAAYSKRRRRDVQPIRRDLAELLRPWLADKTPGEPVFALPDKPARMLRADLDAAGIPYRDDGGRVCDFHALRHTFVTRLARSGASVKVVQTLARHSTPVLTLGLYSHLEISDGAAALAALPDPQISAAPEIARRMQNVAQPDRDRPHRKADTA